MTLKKIEAMFASPLFLAVSILYSVSTVMSVIIAHTFDVVSIILVIALWLAFAAAKGGKLSEKQTGIKMISGCVKAWYIIVWVVVGFFLVLSVLLMAIGPAVIDMAENIVAEDPDYIENEINGFMDSDYYDDFAYDFDDAINGLDNELPFNFSIRDFSGRDITNLLSNLSASSRIIFAIIGIIMLVVCVLLILMNIFFYGNLHKLTKSVCVSFETGSAKLEKVGTVKVWLIVISVFSGLSAIDSLIIRPVSGIAVSCQCAATIIAVIMLSKLANNNEQTPEMISEASAAGETTETDSPEQL